MTKQQKIDKLLKENQQLLDDIYVLIDEDNIIKMVSVKVKYHEKRLLEKGLWFGTPVVPTEVTTTKRFIGNIEEKVKTSEQY